MTTLLVFLMTAMIVADALSRLTVGALDAAGGRSRAVTRRDEIDLVDVAERIGRDVRSGVGVRTAVEDALSAAPSMLPDVLAALRRHATLGDALSRHHPCGDERDVLVHALQLGARHPHVAGRLLDRAVSVVRERRTWRQERRVHSAQARSSARVLTLLPIAFALWGLVTSPSVRQAYATSSVVAVLAIVGLVWNLVGWWWMQRVVGGRG